MDKDRRVICKIISNMLDNPGPCDIYPTGKAYDELEKYIEGVRAEGMDSKSVDALIHTLNLSNLPSQ